MQPSTSSSTTTNSSLPKSRFNWIFPPEKFTATPSNRDGISLEDELGFRQQAAVFIYELGTNLKVYVFHCLPNFLNNIFSLFFKTTLLY